MKKRYLMVLCLVFSFLLVADCELAFSKMLLFSEAEEQLPELDSTKGRVYFYRLNKNMDMAGIAIKMNEVKVTDTYPGEIFFRDVEPGRYKLRFDTGFYGQMKGMEGHIFVKPGEEIYVRTERTGFSGEKAVFTVFTMGLVVAKEEAKLEVVPKSMAKDEIGDLKYKEEKKKKTSSAKKDEDDSDKKSDRSSKRKRKSKVIEPRTREFDSIVHKAGLPKVSEYASDVIYLDPEYRDLEIQKINVMPIIDSRANKEIPLEDLYKKFGWYGWDDAEYQRKVVKGFLEEYKEYECDISYIFPEDVTEKLNSIEKIDLDTLYSIAPDSEDPVMFVIIEEIEHTKSKRFELIELTAVLLDKKNKKILWADWGDCHKDDDDDYNFGIIGAVLDGVGEGLSKGMNLEQDESTLAFLSTLLSLPRAD